MPSELSRLTAQHEETRHLLNDAQDAAASFGEFARELLEYARHRDGCTAEIPGIEGRCSCGLEGVRSVVERALRRGCD